VALTRDVPEAINEVLDEAQGDAPGSAPTTAVFYSISNCQDGLRGISFGNFLLKQVAEELAREEPRLKTFVTLSPVPGFADWLRGAAAAPGEAGVPDQVGAQARALLGELQDLARPSLGRRTARTASAEAICWRLPPTISSRPSAATASPSIRSPASISATGRGSSA